MSRSVVQLTIITIRSDSESSLVIIIKFLTNVELEYQLNINKSLV